MATFAVTLTLCVATAALLLVGASGPTFETWGFRGFPILFAMTFASVGVVVAWRLPTNRIGWLFSLLGAAFGLLGFATEYTAYGALVEPGSLPFVELGGWLLTWLWIPPAGLATTLLLLLFPDGRLPSPRWRVVAWIAIAAIAWASATASLTPGPVQNAPFVDNPLGWPPIDPEQTHRSWPVLLGFLGLAVAILLSASAMVLRFRRSVGVEREQMKWFASAAVFAALVLSGPGTLFNALTTGSPGVSASKITEVLTIGAILTIPLAAGIAILRYHLFDIDLIIRRGVVYGLVTVLLAGAYGGSVVMLQALLSPFTHDDTVVVATSTLAVAALFGPVRSRVQAWVDRLFYRARYDADRVAAAFAGRLQAGIDQEHVARELATVLDRTVRPTEVSIWLRPAEAARPGN